MVVDATGVGHKRAEIERRVAFRMQSARGPRSRVCVWRKKGNRKKNARLPTFFPFSFFFFFIPSGRFANEESDERGSAREEGENERRKGRKKEFRCRRIIPSFTFYADT